MRYFLIVAMGITAWALAVQPIASKVYTFKDRAEMQILIDACRTGHHLCK